MYVKMYSFEIKNPNCYLYSGRGIDREIRWEVIVNTIREIIDTNP